MNFAGCSTDADREAPPPPAAPPAAPLPQLPAECYQPTPHAGVDVGVSVVSALKRERLQLDKSNRSKARCTSYYEALRKGGLSGA